MTEGEENDDRTATPAQTEADEAPLGGHGHGHGHGHGLEGSWDVWLGVPALRVILAAVVFTGFLTIVGALVVWPDGEGRAAAIEEAEKLGFVTEQYDATVDSVRDGRCSYAPADDPQECREFSFIVHEGPDAGGLVLLPEFNLTVGTPTPKLSVGDSVILGYEPSTFFYFYADRDRGASLVWLALLFAAVVIALGRYRGLLALLAMIVTVVALVGFIAPSVLDGNDPVLVSVIAGSGIAFISLYLTHGFTPTTTVALAGTLASLLLTLGISAVFFRLASFSGLATEEGLTLPLVADINLSSLLLGGAVIGALGALDDVTVTQVATVAELHHRNDKLTIPELITSGIRVGREHIASAVNTLLLAYAGASMPLLLVFAAADQPLGVVANSEVVAVEIVRTLCGSIGLVAAVPITTLMAAVLVGTTADRLPRPAAADRAAANDGQNDGTNGESGVDGEAVEPTPTSPPQPAPSWDDFGPVED